MAAWDDRPRAMNQRHPAWDEQRDSLNLWHGIMEREPRKPGLSRKAWLRVAFVCYMSFMLVLAGVILWKVAHPLPHLMP